jgi:hypothetical protein
MSDSKRVCSLFSNASKSGRTYFSGKTQAEVVIPAGARVTLVKSSKLAGNGSEIWSLLVDEPGASDQRRVYETRGDVDLDQHRGQPPPPPISDEIPF